MFCVKSLKFVGSGSKTLHLTRLSLDTGKVINPILAPISRNVPPGVEKQPLMKSTNARDQSPC